MATYKHLRSSTAHKRPTTSIADGQLAINTNTASPGLFFKDSAGTGIVKVGPVHVGTTAPNASPATGGSTGNYLGEQWLDTSVSPVQMKVWNGSAWVGIVADELPVSKLQDGDAGQIVQTDSAGTGVEWSSTSNLPLGSAGTPAYRFQGDPNTGIYSPGADQVAISTNGTGRLFINANGNVGVGTSPTNPLTVVGTAGTGANAALRIEDESAQAMTIGVENDGDVIIDYLTKDLAFSANSSEKLRITSAGNVGIGTSTPSSELHIAGTTSPQLRIEDTDNGFGPISIIATNGGRDTTFRTNQDFYFEEGVGNSRLTIQSGGNVGIGTSTPGSLLHLASATGSATPTPTELRIATTTNAGDWSTTNPWGRISYYSADASAGGPKIQAAIDAISSGAAGTSASFDFKLASNLDATLNSVMRINYLGQVGIGTTSPASRLTVSDGTASGLSPFGGSDVFIDSSGSNYLQFGSGTTGAAAIYFGDADDGDVGGIVYSHSGDSMNFRTNAAERLRITDDGKVGLGTSTPTQALQVAGAIVATGAAATYAADGVYLQNKGSSIFDISAWRTGANASILTFSTDSGSDAAPVERLRIGADGKVGIGTTSPNDILHVVESSASAATPTTASVANFERNGSAGITISSTATGSVFFADSGSSAAGRLQYDHSDNSLGFWANLLERARIDSAGRLLVGTSSQSGGSLLQVNDNRIRIATAKTPASASDTGTAGEICWDADYIYVCTATNTWKRTAISTW